MSITVLPYHNQAFVDQINTAAVERARALEEEKGCPCGSGKFLLSPKQRVRRLWQYGFCAA